MLAGAGTVGCGAVPRAALLVADGDAGVELVHVVGHGVSGGE